MAAFGVAVENDITSSTEGKSGKAAEAAAHGAIARWVVDSEAPAQHYRQPTATGR